MVTRDVLAEASKNAYSNIPQTIESDWEVDTNFPPINNTSSGFGAVVYKNKNTNEVIIAYRGTDQNQIADIHNDIDIALGKRLPQMIEAESLYNLVEVEYGKSNITVTGHSLGGAMAQLIAAQYNIKACSFNAPGVSHLLNDPTINPASFTNITNYSYANDILNILNMATGSKLLGNIEIVPSDGRSPIDAHIFFDSLGTADTIPYYLWYFKNREICQMISKLEKSQLKDEIYNYLEIVGNHLDNTIGYNSKPSIKDAVQTATTAPSIIYDPLLVDLNGDGIKTTSVENGVYFDHQKDGFAERSAWVDEDDGVLVMDKNGDGIINDGSEVFGDNYVKSNGKKATSGFDALRLLNKNNENALQKVS